MQMGVISPFNECPRYDTKQSDGEVPAILELWKMGSTISLPSLRGSLWLGVVASDRVLSMGQIERNPVYREVTLFISKLCIYAKLNCLK